MVKAYLVCKEDVVIEGDDHASCVCGERYEVNRVTVDGYYVIRNEENENHLFSRDSKSPYWYGLWFEIELRDDQG